MSYLSDVLLFVVYSLLIVNNSYAKESLSSELNFLFRDKDCIEASQLTLASPPTSIQMLEKAAINSFTHLPLINLTDIARTPTDKSLMSKINELAQFHELKYTYELIAEEGPPHKRVFKIQLKLGDETHEGRGASLKQAQRAAAGLALANTAYEQLPIKPESEKIIQTPTVILNNIALQLGIRVSYFLITGKEETEISNYASSEAGNAGNSYFQKLNGSIYRQSDAFRVPTEDAQLAGPFSVRVSVGDGVFVGVGHTVQSARHAAATKAIKSMEKDVLLKSNECTSDETVELCKERKEALKSPITRVYETGQKHNLGVEFEVISETGKSHNKLFVTRCKLGDFRTEGEGRSKKDSKREAAEKMLLHLNKLPEIVDGKEVLGTLSTGMKKKKKKKKKGNKLVKNLQAQSVASLLDSFWATTDSKTNEEQGKSKSKKPKGSTQSKSPKDKLLELANILKIDVQFSNLGTENSKFFSLLTLGVHPTHLCLGAASGEEASHAAAALRGLKFLSKSGLLKNTLEALKDQQIIDNFQGFKVDEENVIYVPLSKEKE